MLGEEKLLEALTRDAQNKNNAELPLEFYQKHWKKENKVQSYSDLAPPRVEPRLEEIYRKFAHRLTEYKKELGVNFNVTEKFDPEAVRNKIDA